LIPKITHTYKGNKMTTSTLNTYYCTFCDAVKTIAINFGNKFMSVTESIGRARAAAALAQMGHHDLAKKVMLGDDL
jgi:tRNA(Ile2) C34 agmatinyltransferase TiaS